MLKTDSNPAIKYYNLFDDKPQFFHIMKNFISAKHLHKETEFVFPVNGNIDVMVQDRRFTVKMNELMIIPGNVMHYYLPTDEHIDVINVKFMENWLIPQFLNSQEMNGISNFFQSVSLITVNPVITGILFEMDRFAHTMYTEYLYYGKIIELVSHCLQNPHWITESAPISHDKTRYIDDILKYVQENCGSPLTLKMLADHLGLTESYCSKYFKQVIGTTFLDYLTSRRVSNAERLLKYTDYSIMEIAEYSGFSSIQTFNRVFKRFTGKTPTDYRMQ